MERFNSDTLSSSLISKDDQSSTSTAALMHAGFSDGISHFTVSAAVEYSNRSLFLKVFLRFLLSFLLALSLVCYVASHHQARGQPLQKGLDLTRPFQDRKESASYFGKHHLYGEIPQNVEQPTKDDEASPVHQDDSLLFELHGNRDGFLGQSMERHQSVSTVPNRALEPKKVQLPSSVSFASNSAIPYRPLKPKGRLRRPNIKNLLKIFEDLTDEGLLKLHHRILCLDYKAGKEVVALKTRGYHKVVGIDPLSGVLNSKLTQKYTFTQSIADESFNLVYTRMFDDAPYPALFVAEIERILKVGGFAAMHVSLDVWHNRFITSKLGHAVKPVTLLFQFSKIVYVSTAYACGLDTIIVFKKTIPVIVEGIDLNGRDKRSHEFQSALNNAAHPSMSQPLVDNAVSFSHPKAGITFLYIAKWASNNVGGGVNKVLSRLSSFMDSLVEDISHAGLARKLMIGYEFSAVTVDVTGTNSEVRKLPRIAYLFDQLGFKSYYHVGTD